MGKKVSVIRLAFCAVLACTASPLLHAASTLDKITKTGIVTLGYREASPPFSYVDSNKRPIGYSLDICLKVVDALKRELKRPDLVVKYAPMLSASRMAELIDGDIDIVDLCIHPAKGLKLLQECQKSYQCIVIQPGASDEVLISYLQQHNIPYLDGCLLVGLKLYA